MKTLLLTLSVLGAIAAALNAQPVRIPRPILIVSPDIGDGGMVTFRLRDTNAAAVSVVGQWPDGRKPMEKDDTGVWSVTVGPVPAGVWEYSFEVDGLQMIDPSNREIKPMRNPRTSILQIRGDPPLPWDFQDVPHGGVHQHTYLSKSLGKVRNLVVYTPPGYGRGGRRYPTLYLQHGFGDDEATWVAHGKAHWILDSLIAQGRAAPMVIVMMDGQPDVIRDPDKEFTINEADFERDLLGDVMPFVEANYHVRRDAAGRAIAGLSMGGGQALRIGLNHSDIFGWIGSFSAAPPAPEVIAAPLDHPAQTNRRLKLLWIADGRDDFLLQRNQTFLALLDQKQIHYEWHMTDGNHSWPVWRNYLVDFAPRLFH